MTCDYIGIKQVTAWEQEKDGADGYAVKYSDGYTSWSPKDVFESAYINIGHVGHLPAHKQRVIGEKAVLDDKISKLNGFINSENFNSFCDESEQNRLKKQLHFMSEYSDILLERIENF